MYQQWDAWTAVHPLEGNVALPARDGRHQRPETNAWRGWPAGK